MQKVTDKPLSKCKECGGRLEKLLSAPAIQFKGSGWYVTDYAAAKKAEAKKADGKEEKKEAAEKAPAEDKATPKDTASSKKSGKSKPAPSSGD
jgi:predicted nucleic acid-binding Zn ribbon protein